MNVDEVLESRILETLVVARRKKLDADDQAERRRIASAIVALEKALDRLRGGE